MSNLFGVELEAALEVPPPRSRADLDVVGVVEVLVLEGRDGEVDQQLADREAGAAPDAPRQGRAGVSRRPGTPERPPGQADASRERVQGVDLCAPAQRQRIRLLPEVGERQVEGHGPVDVDLDPGCHAVTPPAHARRRAVEGQLVVQAREPEPSLQVGADTRLRPRGERPVDVEGDRGDLLEGNGLDGPEAMELDPDPAAEAALLEEEVEVRAPGVVQEVAGGCRPPARSRSRP